jgi:glycosyltransferase involved in cell wall biosynthesis
VNDLFLLNSGKAILPELEAYATVLEHAFRVSRVDSMDRTFGDGVVWCFMGLYPKRPPCGLLIHDYRSLSTGKLGYLKDKVKRWRNARPDLRIFLNEQVRKQMDFRDSVPFLILDMGIPEWLPSLRQPYPEKHHHRFGYIGAVCRERGSHHMIEAYLNSTHANDAFLIVGQVESCLRKRYKGQGGIEFADKMPQRQLFPLLRGCEYAVGHFPAHRPHTFQTPTKLLEYAALGMSIIANPSPSNRENAERYGIRVNWGGRHVFDGLSLPQKATDNLDFDATPLMWESRFANAGVIMRIHARLKSVSQCQAT